MNAFAGAQLSITSSNLVELVRARALAGPERPAFQFLAEGEVETARLSRGELDRRARCVAARLQQWQAAGERALLLYPPGLELIVAFLGCLYAGVVAVPAYPPRRRRDLPRLAPLLADARPRLLLAPAALLARLPPMENGDEETLERLATDEIADEIAREWRAPALSPDSLAFLQYTSGSTADPKGVMVTHANLLDNQRQIEQAFGQSEESVVVGWLPLYHDMGLIGNILQPLYNGGRCVLMPPMAFLTRPRRWLEAISRYRATTSGGPDFAYRLCVERIPPPDREGLDLSTWEVAFNGAEPVRSRTLERFARAFAPQGFSPRAFFPCYGLAEATLFVAGGPLGEEPRLCRVDAGALEGGRVVTGAKARGGARRKALVGCGGRAEGEAAARLVITDPESGTPCPPDRVGEIWLAGPGVARGYWGRPEESREIFQAHLSPAAEADGGSRGPFLRTGDLGFLDREGTLFVTGRRKDLIILRGRNLYPQDVELAAADSHPALRPDAAAAFAVEVAGEERLVVVAELERRREGESAAAAEAVRRAVFARQEVQPHAVVLIRAGTLPRTSSGKVRRRPCAEAYLAGRLVEVGRWEEGAEPVVALPPALDRRRLLALSAAERRRLLAAELAAPAARLLGVELARIDPDRPLELDSLAAVELRNHLAATAGVELPLESFLGGPSLAHLADEAAHRLERGDDPSAALPPGVGPATGIYPLSWGQRSLWFLHRLAPESAAYNLAFAAHLLPAAAELDVGALARACHRLSRRHPILATTYRNQGGEPVQRVPAAPRPAFRVVDARDWSAGRVTAALAAAAHRPIDLRQGPVACWNLFVRPRGEAMLLLVVHHVAADLWSLVILVDELGRLYAAEVSSSGDPLPPLPRLHFTYPDFVRWQQALLDGPRGEELLAHWSRELAGQPAAADLPLDRPRPAAGSHRGASLPLRLDAALGRRARELAARSGATLYTLLLAVFQALLHRLGGQQDFLVGSPAAGRSEASFEGVVGYFVNLLPLRARPAGDPAFTSYLEQTRRSVLAALEHQDLPFPLLVERLQPVRDPARHPLFQAVLAFEHPHRLTSGAGGAFILGQAGGRMGFGDLTLESVDLPRRATPLDLLMTVADADESLTGSLTYSADLFDATTAARLGRSFCSLLAAVAEQPGRRLSELPLLTAAEGQQLTVEWNDTAAPYPEVTVPVLFARVAGERPETVALVGDRGEGPPPEHLSYGHLRREAARRADRLRRLGTGPERAVAVALPRSVELVLSLLSVLEAGGFYLVLDPEWPRRRLTRCLEEMRPVVLFTGDGELGDPEELTTATPGLRILPAGPAAEEAAAGERSGGLEVAAASAPPPSPSPPGWPDQLALALYTSGSTGRPKAIGLTHRGVVRLARSTGLTRFAADVVMLEISPVTFDVSTAEIWGTLLTGGRLVVPRPAPLALGALARTFARQRVTSVIFPAGLFHLMVDEQLPALAPLRWIVAGGDVLSPERCRKALAFLPDACLINGYGPAEATTATSGEPLRLPDAVPALSVPIGRPISNTRVYLLSPALAPVPVGCPGELAIGGPGLARGYLGQPARTAARFVPAPGCGRSEAAGEHLYLSGDLARFLAGGRLQFLGRVDRQVKVRGFRVEPAEVEAALAAHPRVKEAMVLARDNALVAYVVANGSGEGGGELDRRELAAFLAERLPAFMVPGVFLPLPALPRNRHGKVKLEALPVPRPPGRSSRPRSALEQRVAAVWREVLGVPQVGLDESFFELGGHSLLMIKAHSRLEEALGRPIPLMELFSHPTVGSLAAWLDREGEAPPLARDAVYARAGRRRNAMGRRRKQREGFATGPAFLTNEPGRPAPGRKPEP